MTGKNSFQTRPFTLFGIFALSAVLLIPLGAEAKGIGDLSLMPMSIQLPAWLVAQRARDTFDRVRVGPADEEMRKMQSEGEAAPKSPDTQKTNELKKDLEDWLLGLGKKKPGEEQTKASGSADVGAGPETTTSGTATGGKEKAAK
jgi:hypothetical protein